MKRIANVEAAGRRFHIMVAAMLAAGAAVAEPSYTSQITIGGYAGDETLENFPVLVRIKNDQPKGFAYSQCQGEDGADISFTDATGNVIPYEIDTWNPEGESTVWVKVPSVTPTASGATTFNFRWCDSAATSTSTSNTWDSSYVMVFHMGEESGVCANSAQTGSKYDATPKGTTTDNKLYSGDDAPVGGARTVSTALATKSALVVPNYDDEKVGSNFTWSAWSRRIATSKGANVFVRREAYGSGSGGWSYHWVSSGNQYLNGGTAPSDAAGTKAGVKGAVTDVWMHQVFVFDGTAVRSYRDGVLAVSGTLRSAATDNGAALGIGNGNTGGNVYQFAGSFDECRLKKGSVSADWVKAEYDTVKTAGFLTYGDAMQSGDAPLFVAAVVDDDKVTKHTASVTCAVSSLGPGATKADVSLKYWIDGDATTNTVDLGSLTEKGSLTANLENLAPGTTYCVQIVATNDKSETDESAVAKFTTDTYLTVDALTDAAGIGGDTITVSGTVEAFDAGKTCELTVLTGDSETTTTNEWSGLAGSTLSADADSTEQEFSFSLCETDTASPRYIAPGSTVYVAVKAKIGDWVMQSAAQAVTTKNTAAKPTPTWTTDQRTLTLTGTLSDLGMTGKTSVSLWRYNTETKLYDQEGEAITLSSTEDSYEFTARGEEFGTSYKFVVRATNISAGETATNSVESAVKTFKPVDAATYTWIGRGTSGVWEDAANWSDNKSGDCLGWPKAVGVSVDFAYDENVSNIEILFTNSYTVANLYLTNSNVKVTFKKGEVAEGATVPTVSGTFNLTGTNNVFTVDGMKLSTSSSVTLGENAALTLTGAACFTQPSNTGIYFYNTQGGVVTLLDESTLTTGRYFVDKGAKTIIRDSTMTASKQTRWFNTDGLVPVLRFEGTHPRYQQSSNWFAPYRANADLRIEFCIPKGGYQKDGAAWVPLCSPATDNDSKFGSNGSGKVGVLGTATIYVEQEVASSKEVSMSLISWPAGIYKSVATIGSGHRNAIKFAWKDSSGAETTEDLPVSLDVTIPGSAGCILIIE